MLWNSSFQAKRLSEGLFVAKIAISSTGLEAMSPIRMAISVTSDPLVDCGRILDRFYIPTRYPNGFDYGKPGDYYTETDSQQAIGCAEKILRYCADRLSR